MYNTFHIFHVIEILPLFHSISSAIISASFWRESQRGCVFCNPSMRNVPKWSGTL